MRGKTITERWIGGCRRELLDRTLIWNQNHLRRILRQYETHQPGTGGFGARALRAALDSSPLWGAGRVEDTINLMGHALRKALSVIAVLQGRGQTAGIAIVAAQAGAPQLAASSLKAALDRDWDDPVARDRALAQVLGLADQVEAFAGDQAAAEAVAVARQVRDQDVDLSGPTPALRRGVARDRRISVEDAQMRHGRKSRSVPFDGYKRHVLTDLDTGLVTAVDITPANALEASVTGDITADLDAAGPPGRAAHRQGLPVFFSCPRTRAGPGDLLRGLAGAQRLWPLRQGSVHHRLRRRAADLSRPGEHRLSARQDGAFPERHLRGLPAPAALHPSRNGRSVSIHPDEELLAELRQRQQPLTGAPSYANG